MEREEFDRMMAKILDRWGSPGQNEGQGDRIIEEYWEYAESKDEDTFTQAVNLLLEHRKYSSFPQLGEITSYYQDIYQGQTRYERVPKAPVDLRIRDIEDIIKKLPEEQRARLWGRCCQQVQQEFNDEFAAVRDGMSRTGLRGLREVLLTGERWMYIRVLYRQRQVVAAKYGLPFGDDDENREYLESLPELPIERKESEEHRAEPI